MSLEMNRLLEHHGQLSCFGNSFLSDLIKELPDSVHVKDAKTGKYLQSNYPYIEALGLKSMDDLIGLTTNDLCSDHGIYKKDVNIFMSSWKNKQTERVEKLEYQVRSTKCPVSIKWVYYTVDGFIQFEHVKKLAIPDHENKKIISIFTYAQNLTFQLRLLGLFQLYQKYYPKKQAIQQILRYLKLDHYFDQRDLPTCMEIQVLFAMRDNPRHKCVAKHLDCSIATVDNHISRLTHKLSNPVILHELLAQLRAIPIDKNGTHDAYI